MPIERYHAAGIEYDGLESHIEQIYASSAAVAKRAMKTFVNKRIGQQKHRLVSIDIGEPQPVPYHAKSPV